MTDTENSDEKPEKMSDAEDRYDKARKMLGGIPMGGHIDIVRTKPNWCKGYLDRIDANPDEPINLDDLRDEYGGKTLNLRAYDPDNKYLGSATIHFPDPPKKDGRRLSYDDSEEAEMERAKRQPESGGGVNELVKLMMHQQNQMMNQLTAVFNAQLTAAQKQSTVGAAAADPLAQIERIGDTLERLESLKGKIGGGGGEGGGGINLQKGMDALIEFFASKQRHEMELELAKIQRQPQQNQPVQKLDALPLPPRQPPAAVPPVAQPPAAVPPVAQPPAAVPPETVPAAMPANVSPQNLDDAALLMAVASRFQQMDKKEQSQAVQALLQMVDPAVLADIGEETDEETDEEAE